MKISEAGVDDVAGLARLIWMMAAADERAQEAREPFAADLALWWAGHRQSHSAFVARLDDEPEIVGMAWVALVPRVPRPGSTSRLSADIQSVFVTPQHRGRGIGSALIEAVTEHATGLGAARVEVHSGRTAISFYQRLGFASSRQLLQKPTD